MTLARKWYAAIAVTAAFLMLAIFAMNANANSVVTVTSDNYDAAVGTSDGYTVTITSDAPETFNRIKFLLPGHGTAGSIVYKYGAPKTGDDLDTNFGYVAGSSTVQDNAAADPTQDGRWLYWDDFYYTDAVTSLVLHFNVITPYTAAYQQAGATIVNATEPVTGTFKGGEIHLLQAPEVGISATVNQPHPAKGQAVTYTTVIHNYLSQAVTVDKSRIGVSGGFNYVRGTTTGDYDYNPGVANDFFTWGGDVTIKPGDTFSWSYDVVPPCGQGKSNIRARATFADPLPGGATLVGSGPVATVYQPDC